MVINRKVLPWILAGIALAAILPIVLVMVTQAAPESAPHRQGASITPDVVSYQGQINIGGIPYSGTGYFRFAIVDSYGVFYWSNDGTTSGYFTECSDWNNYVIGPAGAGNHIWGNVHVFSPTSPAGIRGLISEIRNVSGPINFSSACTGLSNGGNHVWSGNVAEPNGACGDDDNAACAAIGLTRGHTFDYTTTVGFTCGGDNDGYVLNGGIYGAGDETNFESRVCLIHAPNASPTTAITLTVVNGLFNVMLGETNPITSGIFSDSDRWLRVWFDDGMHGVELLAPDTQLTTAPFAFRANESITSTWSTWSVNADTATYATTAGNATTADSATTALTATTAMTATYATTAGSAITADSATTALTATNAMTATYATTAGSATTADSATTALTATNATTATNLVASPWARIYNNSAITIANNTWITLTFNSERWDTNALHDTNSNTSRMVAPSNGVYLIECTGRFAANTTGQRSALLIMNAAGNVSSGTTLVFNGVAALALSRSPVMISTIYQLTAGDYVECFVYQNSGGNLTMDVISNDSPEFMMVRMP